MINDVLSTFSRALAIIFLLAGMYKLLFMWIFSLPLFFVAVAFMVISDLFKDSK